MTEDEAKTKWCPEARLAAPVDSIATGTSGNRYGQEFKDWSMCIGSACMAWRWVKDTYKNTEHGYCGKAGKP